MIENISCPITDIICHKDERGSIQTIVENENIDSVLVITSKKGSVRANHYHKSSGHYCILTSGKMRYYERPVGSKEKPIILDVQPNQLFWTGALMEHAMVFTEDSVMFCFSTGNRNQDDYEHDLVRLNFKLEEQ